MSTIRSLIGLALVFGFCSSLVEAKNLKTEVESFIQSHRKDIVGELVELLSIPDVSADKKNIRRKAARLQQMFAKRGFASELLETGGNPLVYGELRTPGATRTLLLYCHYDGQPVDRSRWKQEDPFQPILRDGRLDKGGEERDFSELDQYKPDWRLYARSSSDDTSPIVAILSALDALKAAGEMPSSNLSNAHLGWSRAPHEPAHLGFRRARYCDLRARARSSSHFCTPIHPVWLRGSSVI